MIRKWNDRYEIYLTQDPNGGGREEKHVEYCMTLLGAKSRMDHLEGIHQNLFWHTYRDNRVAYSIRRTL